MDSGGEIADDTLEVRRHTLSKDGFLVVGAGNIGSAALLLLTAYRNGRKYRLYCGDQDLDKAKRAVDDANKRADDIVAKAFELPPSGDLSGLECFDAVSVVLDCLPGGEAPRIAQAAVNSGCHYANLTEYVDETREIVERFAKAKTGLVLQTGLAPGFVNVLACQLIQRAKEKGIKPDDVRMRVGALPMCAQAPHFYGITWSSIGVATEYLKRSECLREGLISDEESLTRRELVVLAGETFEEALTSGGAANLPERFKGAISSLDYKTLRYPGHYEWVERLLKDNPTPESLDRRLASDVPVVHEDRVVIYVSVEGSSGVGRERLDRLVEVRPSTVLCRKMSAIARTTAASLVQIGFWLMQGSVAGVVFQTEIDARAFLDGDIVRTTYFGESTR